MTTNATNGHAVPNPQPGDLTPAVRPVKRTLYVEEEDNGITSAWEASDEDLVEECGRRGLFTDEQCREMLSGNDTDSNPVNGAPLVGTTPSGEPVRMVGAERAEVERMMPKPSEWIREWCAQSFGTTFSSDSQRNAAEIAGIVAYLDERERIGRGT